VVATTLVWTFALCFSLATCTFSVDHFERISPARRIARYGELPFRDFFDPHRRRRRIGGVIGPAVVLAAWMWYRFARSRRTASSIDLVRRHGNLFTELAIATETPSSTALLPKPRLTGLVAYLRRCTQPSDRVFAAWFVPGLYFFSGRTTGTDSATLKPCFAGYA
jgi:hypothetical protein